MEQHWVAILGAVFGTIGAITGIIGTIVSVRSYRMAKSIKALDLRLEAHRARNDLHVAFVRLQDLRERAIESRKAAAAATSQTRSGAMQRWEQQWEQDKQQIARLSAQVPRADADYDPLTPKQLEQTLVELHRTKGWVDDLLAQYEESLAQDERTRQQIFEVHRDSRR